MEFQEYPKHITVGKDKDGNPVTKIVQNRAEEDALLPPKPAPAKPAAPAAASKPEKGQE